MYGNSCYERHATSLKFAWKGGGRQLGVNWSAFRRRAEKRLEARSSGSCCDNEPIITVFFVEKFFQSSFNSSCSNIIAFCFTVENAIKDEPSSLRCRTLNTVASSFTMRLHGRRQSDRERGVYSQQSEQKQMPSLDLRKHRAGGRPTFETEASLRFCQPFTLSKRYARRMITNS